MSFPTVHGGETVEYRLRPDNPTWLGAVTLVQKPDVIVAMPVHKFGNKNALPSDLLHEDDPRLQDKEWVTRYFNPDNEPEYKGVWRVGPQRRRLDALEARLVVVEAALASLSQDSEPAAEADETDDPQPKRRGRPPKNREAVEV